MAKSSGEGTGPTIAIIVIVIILALGGLYYLTEEIGRIRSTGGVTATESTL